MDHVCFALPLLPGKSEAARAFQRELGGSHQAAYAASEERIGITKESWYLQHAPHGDLLLAYIESWDFQHALLLFGASQDPFDRWFKGKLREVTGVDLNIPPAEPLSEQLSAYKAMPRTVPV